MHLSLEDEFLFFPTVGLKVTQKCGLKCGFCSEPIRIGKAASIDRMKALVSKLHRYGTKRICITGGEPSLYKNIVELLQHIKSLNMEIVYLAADGKALSRKEQIFEIADRVRFSVHGMSNTHNDIVGRRYAFEQIEDCIRLAKKYKSELAVATVINRQNISEVSRVMEWAKGLQIERFYLFGMTKSGLGEDYQEKNGKVSADEFNKTANVLVEKSNGDIRIIPHPNNDDAECILLYENGDMIIDPYHKEAPYQKKIGNFFENSRQEILNSLKEEPKSWDDCLQRFQRSTVREITN